MHPQSSIIIRQKQNAITYNQIARTQWWVGNVYVDEMIRKMMNNLDIRRLNAPPMENAFAQKTVHQ